MIDWITARCSMEAFPDAERRALALKGDRVMRYNPLTGIMVYETTAWDSVRSDSHSVVCRLTPSDLWIQGSPARCIGDGDTVFGAGASAAHDLAGCVQRMVQFIAEQLELSYVPPVILWELTHFDVTRNLILDSLVEVRQLLAFLRNAEGGRYRVNQPDGDTVYWNKNSRYHKSKAYAKGPHLRYQMKRRNYFGRRYTPEEIAMADRLARLERSVFSRHWKKNWKVSDWRQITPEMVDKAWHDFFDSLVGGQVIMNDEELKQKIESVAVTAGQAKAAYMCWHAIQSMGWEVARENHTKTTWYRNLRILRDAGLRVTDLGNGKIVPFRAQKIIIGQVVSSWGDLRRMSRAA